MNFLLVFAIIVMTPVVICALGYLLMWMEADLDAMSITTPDKVTKVRGEHKEVV